MTTKKNIPYLEQLRSELVRSISRQEARSPAPLWWRSRLLLAAVAAGVLLVAGAVSAVVLTGGQSGEAPGPVNGPGPALGSCVEQFSVETLASRDFAFDGTVSGVVTPGDAQAEEGAAPTMVTFQVRHWYKGGGGDSVTLKTYEQPGAVTSIGGSLDLSVGTRLLAAGDDDFLWSCGFSMPYTESNARLFSRAFGD
jgi:hypothetical protein